MKKKTAKDLLEETVKADNNYGYVLIEHKRGERVIQNSNGLSLIEMIGLLNQMSVNVSIRTEDKQNELSLRLY